MLDMISCDDSCVSFLFTYTSNAIELLSILTDFPLIIIFCQYKDISDVKRNGWMKDRVTAGWILTKDS